MLTEDGFASQDVAMPNKNGMGAVNQSVSICEDGHVTNMEHTVMAAKLVLVIAAGQQA